MIGAIAEKNVTTERTTDGIKIYLKCTERRNECIRRSVTFLAEILLLTFSLCSSLSIGKKDQNLYVKIILSLSLCYPAVVVIIDTSSSNLELSIGFLTICLTPQMGATSSFLYCL